MLVALGDLLVATALGRHARGVVAARLVLDTRHGGRGGLITPEMFVSDLLIFTGNKKETEIKQVKAGRVYLMYVFKTNFRGP